MDVFSECSNDISNSFSDCFEISHFLLMAACLTAEIVSSMDKESGVLVNTIESSAWAVVITKNRHIILSTNMGSIDIGFPIVRKNSKLFEDGQT